MRDYYFVCRHGRHIDRYSECCKDEYPVKHIETVVWNTLKDYLSTIEWLGNRAGSKAKEQIISVKNSQKKVENEMERLKAEKIRQYEFYAEGVITKDEYIRKKQALCDKIKELEAKKQENTDLLETQEELLEDSSALKSLSAKFSIEDRLSRKMVLAFIAAVYVFDPNTIEVVFQYEDEIRKLMGSLEREEHIAQTV